MDLGPGRAAAVRGAHAENRGAQGEARGGAGGAGWRADPHPGGEGHVAAQAARGGAADEHQLRQRLLGHRVSSGLAVVARERVSWGIVAHYLASTLTTHHGPLRSPQRVEVNPSAAFGREGLPK